MTINAVAATIIAFTISLIVGSQVFLTNQPTQPAHTNQHEGF